MSNNNSSGAQAITAINSQIQHQSENDYKEVNVTSIFYQGAALSEGDILRDGDQINVDYTVVFNSTGCCIVLK